MKYRQTFGSRIAYTVIYFMLVIVIIAMLYPFLSVLAISLSSAGPLIAGKVTIIPKEITLSSYVIFLKNKGVYTALLNTVFYVSTATVFRLFITAMIAYALSYKTFVLKKQITLFLVITMFISGGLIPTYFVVKACGLVDNRLVYIIPAAVDAWSVIIYRTFFQTLPYELREAAKMDGASEFYILSKIIVPLSKPLFATMAIFSILGVWNDYFTGFIYLQSESKYPIQMILMSLLKYFMPGRTTMDPSLRWDLVTPESVKAAAVMLVAFPILAVYPFFQKYFTKGMLIGSIKG
jgi:putative aldouronate transport system permease protein